MSASRARLRDRDLKIFRIPAHCAYCKTPVEGGVLARYIRNADATVECEVNAEGKRCFSCKQGLFNPRFEVDRTGGSEAMAEYNPNWGNLKDAPSGIKGKWSKPEKKKGEKSAYDILSQRFTGRTVGA